MRVLGKIVPDRPTVSEAGQCCATCKRYDWFRARCPATMQMIAKGQSRGQVCEHYIVCPTCDQ